MRHPLPADLGWIDDGVDDWPCTLRWDVKGHTPTPPALAARLWDGVVTQRVIEGEDGRPHGLLQVVDVDLVDGTGRLEVMARSEDAVATAWPGFVVEVTHDLPLRSLDVVAAADGMRVDAFAPGAFEIGRLRERRWRGCGRRVDVVLYEIGLGAPDGGFGAAAVATA
jgi:hypothetical protein